MSRLPYSSGFDKEGYVRRDWQILPQPETIASAPAQPAPTASKEDIIQLYPAHDGRALYAYIDFGPWPQRVLIDTGSTSLTVSESLADRLLTQHLAHEGPEVTVGLADGSEHSERTIVIDKVTIGSHALHDVRAGVTPDGADMLLGLPLLNQIGRFTIDSANHKLIFG
jgi:clan AA aspartic protease (TIGR02281 family)